jgi:hypothetical protein
MTNLLLFSSSILCTCIHYIGFFLYNPKNSLLEYSYIFSLITSIINHGLKHDLFKLIDRIIISASFFINIFFLRKIYVSTKNKYLIENAFIIMIFSVFMFFLSKIIDNKKNKYIPHAIAHILITLTNLILIKEYSNYKFDSLRYSIM